MIKYTEDGTENVDKKIVVLIPAYQPKESLTEYVGELFTAGLSEILLVDDGGGENYQSIFASCEELGAKVLTHPVNRGKGEALKTGFSYVLEHDEDTLGVVTADSDGQHKTADIKRIAEALAEKPEALILGVRDFTGPDVPPKSRGGNLLTIRLFHLLYGKYISDTQTGLRGIGRALLPRMNELRGSRFEYEMGMLIDVVRQDTEIVEVPIETVYQEENKGTHFRPIVDSVKIYAYLLGSFFKYVLSSLSASLIDLGCFTLFNLTLFSGLPLRGNVFASTILARVISSIYNFLMNRKVVFRSGGSALGQAVKYYVLVVVQMLCSALLVYLFTRLSGVNSTVIKVVVDTVLFFVSFQIQNRVIFKRPE